MGTEVKITWPLPNLKPIKPVGFWHEVTLWGCPASVYRQPERDLDGSWFTPIIFPINRDNLIGGGFMVKVFYSGPKQGTQEYFTYRDCEHEFEHKSGGNCYHIYTCKKCGARYDVDSSD